MKVQYVSDLHLEFPENREWLNRHPLKAAGDVLVIAGDFFRIDDPTGPIDSFLDWCSDSYGQTLIVPGNHEWYGSGDVLKGENSRMLRKNVGYFYNEVVRIEDTDFILSTMWSKINPTCASSVRRGMNDFHLIAYDGHLFTTDDFNAEHLKCLDFIKNAVEASAAPHLIVATHHVPSARCVAPCNVGSTLSSAFAVDLTSYIEASRIEAWIYGHSHTSIETTLGTTRILSNQLGYVELNEQSNFSRDKTLEL